MHKEQLAGDRVYVIHDFFTPQVCEAHIARSEELGYEDAPITTKSGAVMRKEVRDNTRLMVESRELAALEFARARPFLQERKGSWELHGFNERLRYYRYDRTQSFRRHFDGSFIRCDTERSLVTFMIYLNDDFTGGQTVFYHPGGEVALQVVPSRGMALVFDHAQLHEGAPVVSGRKYVLRTDVMYTHSEESEG